MNSNIFCHHSNLITPLFFYFSPKTSFLTVHYEICIVSMSVLNAHKCNWITSFVSFSVYQWLYFPKLPFSILWRLKLLLWGVSGRRICAMLPRPLVRTTAVYSQCFLEISFCSFYVRASYLLLECYFVLVLENIWSLVIS